MPTDHETGEKHEFVEDLAAGDGRCGRSEGPKRRCAAPPDAEVHRVEDEKHERERAERG